MKPGDVVEVEIDGGIGHPAQPDRRRGLKPPEFPAGREQQEEIALKPRR